MMTAGQRTMKLSQSFAEDDADGSRWSVDFSETKPLLSPPKVDWEGLHRTKLRIHKSVAGLAVGVAVFLVGLGPIDELQRHDVPAVLGVRYAATILGSLLTNVYGVRKLGSKRAVVVGALLYSTSIVANFYPSTTMLLPSAAIAGLGGALLWATLGSHLARLAGRYAVIADSNDGDGAKTLVFGIEGFAAHSGAVASSLISSVLWVGVPSVNSTAPLNGSCSVIHCSKDLHGGQWTADDREANETAEVQEFEEISTDMFLAFCLAVALFAIVIIGVLVDPLPSLGIVEHNVEQPAWRLLLAIVGQWSHPGQLLLVPMSLVYGLQDAFWRLQFNKAYFPCLSGDNYTKLAMVCYSTAALLSSLAFGWFGRCRWRLVAVPILAFSDVAALTSMLFWRPPPDSSVVTLVLTAITGLASGGLGTLITAFYSIVFPEDLDAAYSNLYFWSFLGSAFMVAQNFRLCLRTKLIAVLACVAIGLFGYIGTEILLARRELRDTVAEDRENSAKGLLVPAGF